jgi:hypothetical protein
LLLLLHHTDGCVSSPDQLASIFVATRHRPDLVAIRDEIRTRRSLVIRHCAPSSLTSHAELQASKQSVSVGALDEQVGESRVVIEAEHPFKGSDKYYARLIRR